MTRLSAGLDTALSADAVLAFIAMEAVLPAATLRLLDGAAAALTVASHAFNGQDATYGTMGAIEAVTDGADNSAPSVRLTLFPPSDAAMAVLADAAAQGSQITLWEGAVNPSTGVTVTSPYVFFLGELDIPTLKVDSSGVRTVEWDIVSAFDRFFDNDEGVRLNDSWQQSVWDSGERGLIGSTAVQTQLPWGVDGVNYVSHPPLGGPASAARGDYGSYAAY